MENKISLERFEKIHRPLEDRRRALQREIGRIKAKISRIAGKRDSDEQKQVFDPKTAKTALAAAVRQPLGRQIVHGFVSRINVGSDELEFTYRFREISERTAKSQHLHGQHFLLRQALPDGDEPLYIRLPKSGATLPPHRYDTLGAQRAHPSIRAEQLRPTVESKISESVRAAKARG
jgi:hypothetical protein